MIDNTRNGMENKGETPPYPNNRTLHAGIGKISNLVYLDMTHQVGSVTSQCRSSDETGRIASNLTTTTA